MQDLKLCLQKKKTYNNKPTHRNISGSVTNSSAFSKKKKHDQSIYAQICRPNPHL